MRTTHVGTRRGYLFRVWQENQLPSLGFGRNSKASSVKESFTVKKEKTSGMPVWRSLAWNTASYLICLWVWSWVGRWGRIKKKESCNYWLNPDPRSVTAEVVGQNSFVIYGLAIIYLYIQSHRTNIHWMPCNWWNWPSHSWLHIRISWEALKAPPWTNETRTSGKGPLISVSSNSSLGNSNVQPWSAVRQMKNWHDPWWGCSLLPWSSF